MNFSRDALFGKLLDIVQDSSVVKRLIPIIQQLEVQAYDRGRASVQEEIQKIKQGDFIQSSESALIMLIDDNDDIRQLVQQLLQQGGYQVITGQSGEECLKLLQTYKPDVLILDINLEDSDGEAIAEHLRQKFETRFLPVVFITAYISQEEANELNRGDDAKKRNKRFIAKPFDIPELFNLIEELRQSQRIAGELPWTPPLPKEVRFEAIPVLSIKEFPGDYVETKKTNLKDRIDEYLSDGYTPESFEFIVVELLSRGKVRVDMEGHMEKLTLEDIDQHMITAYAAELFNRFYPKRAVPTYVLEGAGTDPNKLSPDLRPTQKIHLKKNQLP
jgi:CheY-like chemotaxis protein